LMPSKRPVEILRDFMDLRVGVTRSPVSVDTFRAVDARPVEMDVEYLRDAMAQEEVETGETTYPRFFVLGHDKVSKVINHTEHNVFLTSIITNQDLWNRLTEEQQKIFEVAAQNAADIERRETLAIVSPVQAQAASIGIPTVTMSDSERQKFIAATRTLYSKYETWFSPGVLSGITSIH